MVGLVQKIRRTYIGLMYVFCIVLFSARPSLPQIAMEHYSASKIRFRRRIAKQSIDHPPGTAFDSSDARGANYSFVLGRGRVVRAMDLAVRSMRVGERSILICRSDYGYGSEGLCTTGGVVVVPPFATLRFDLTLVGTTAAASS